MRLVKLNLVRIVVGSGVTTQRNNKDSESDFPAKKEGWRNVLFQV